MTTPGATLTPGALLRDLPLFPLGTVLFPQGLLALRVFEARYLDMVSHCLRHDALFGVVTLIQGNETRSSTASSAKESARFETQGCLARIRSCDSDQPGILQIDCVGTHRFELSEPRQQADGLWQAQALVLEDDMPTALTPELQASAAALQQAMATLETQGHQPFMAPYQLDDAGWVANRWCEILPIPLPTRHKLMALPDPLTRLQLVDGFLRRHGILSD